MSNKRLLGLKMKHFLGAHFIPNKTENGALINVLVHSVGARFYKGSLKVSKGRARLDHKIAKLRKARAQNVWNELDFCPKII